MPYVPNYARDQQTERRRRLRPLVVALSGIVAVIAIVCGGLLTLLASTGSPRVTTFKVYNRSDTLLSNFKLTGPDGTFNFGSVPSYTFCGQSTNQSTAYHVPYTYAFPAAGKTITGTAVEWGDAEIRGSWSECTLEVKRVDGTFRVYPDMGN